MNRPEPRSHRFYSNENFPNPVVEFLRAIGHDILTSHDAGLSNRGVPDRSVLEFATREARAILTFNRRDFVRLHTSVATQHAGIIVCSEDRDYERLAERIHNQVKDLSSLAKQLIKVDRPSQPRPVPKSHER